MGREAELSAAPRYVEDPSTCYFYHSMEQPGFGLQRGEWDLRGRFDESIGHVDLAGARVLDVGCASGYLSFSAERSGVADVYSFDMEMLVDSICCHPRTIYIAETMMPGWRDKAPA